MTHFGVQLTYVIQDPTRADYEMLEKIALLSEDLGFHSAWLNDHLFQFPLTSEPFLECWTVLSSLASVTRRLRLGTLALCVSFRYPSILAKMASTLDIISKGRIELGIGAGWYEKEHIAYGIPFLRYPARAQQLKEAIHIIKKLWTEDKPTFKGEYYRIEEAYNNPKPVQSPHPPIWVGGSGKSVLRVAAELADGYNTFNCSVTECERRLAVLEKYCETVDRKFNTLKKSYHCPILIAKEVHELKEKVKRFRENSPWERIRNMPFDKLAEIYILGTPEQCIEKISQYSDLGLEDFMLLFPDAAELRSLELFAETVLPKFR